MLRPPPLEQHAGGQRAGNDLESRPMSRGIQIGRHSGLAPPMADCRLPGAKSFRIAAVEIGAARQAEGIGSREEAPDQRIGLWYVDDVHGAAPRALRRVRGLVVLQSPEIRQK